ncbi:MAG: nucleotide exchange factor GrpE [Chitinophagia bacterium]|nr:nucleotide exchange factor GrpE [Chitinophagia bacterium]
MSKNKKNQSENLPPIPDILSKSAEEFATQMWNEAAEEAEGEAEATQANLQAEIASLHQQVQEMKDKHLRLMADFDNLRRRTAKEKLEVMQTAGKDVMTAMLAVLDDVGHAEKLIAGTEDINAVKDGVNLVFGKLKNTLTQKGLKVMDVMHQPFDADLHEAITEIPAPSEDLIGKVVAVVAQGYMLNDKLIRHAQVVLGK